MNRKKPWALRILPAGGAIAFGQLFSGNLAAQCQMCRVALTNSAEGQRWTQGIHAGILLLLTTPFLIAGCIAFLIYRPQVDAAFMMLRARFVKAVTRTHDRARSVLAIPRCPKLP